MNFHFSIFGWGFGFQVGGFDAMNMCFVIFSWHIMKNYQVWRSETHAKNENGYHYRCIKNGVVVEDLSFRSPVVNNA